MRKGLLIAVGVAALAMFLASSASAVNFGGRYLVYGSCCDGGPLWGSSSSIIVNSASPESTGCLIFRNDAEASGFLLQAGATKCGLSSGGLDGTCSLSNNLVRFVEVLN